jgi:hypothetical protein
VTPACVGQGRRARIEGVSAPEEWSAFPANAPSTAVSVARAALIAFAARTPATQADVDQVMRALAEHDSWLVPVAYGTHAWGQTGFAQTLPFPDRGPQAMLNVFTDPAAAALGEEHASGAYGGPVSGVRLLRTLDPGLSALIVNPGSPREHQWFIAVGGFDIAAQWGSAIAVEHALARRGNGPVPVSELLSHRYELLIEKDTQAPAQIFLPEIDGQVAVCFTAPDRTAEFTASLPPAARPLAEVANVEGPQLFEMVRSMGAAGVIVNAGSDDQTALTQEDLAEVAHARSVRL